MDTRKDKAGRTSLAHARKVLTQNELFFFEQAGWSYKPGQESAQSGRIRCAKSLAHAEQTARNLGWSYIWEQDDMSPYEDMLGDHAYWCQDEQDGVEHTHNIEYCQLLDENDNVIESLGAIIDPDSNCRRVVQAELASEAEYRLDKEIETLDAH